MAFKYRADIDGLRAVAVLPVVLGHAGIPGFDGGFVGVDVFFVISGFLITALILEEIQSRRFSFRDFYMRRVRRILPALLTMMIATFLMGWVLLPPAGLEALGRSALSVLLLSSNMWLWQTTGDYFGAAAEVTPLLHTWSLAVEEQFYLIFPLIMVALFRSRLPVALCMLLLTVLGFGASFYITEQHPTAAFYLMPVRAWEFGVGAVIALSPVVMKRRNAALAVCAGLGLIAYAVWSFDDGVSMPGVHAVLPVIGAALVISGGRAENRISRLLGSPLPVFIGLLSYSLYLWHWPVQVGLRLVTGVYHLPIALGLASVGVSFVLAYASRRWIEEPLRCQRGLFFTAAVLVPMCIALVCLGAATIKGGGLPSRIDPALLAVYQDATEPSSLHENCMLRKVGELPCALSYEASPAEVLVWGDSHAGAALPAFQAWGQSTGRAVVAETKAACPPILGVERADRQERACAASSAATMAWLRETASIETVILHARWPLALTGQRAAGEAGGAARYSSPQGAEIRMDTALAATVSALRMMGKEVFLLGSVAELGLDVPQAYFAQSRLFGAPVAQNLPTDPRDRTKAADAVLRRVAQTHGAEVIELYQNPAAALRAPLRYADDDHLSAHGAMERVLPALLDALPALPSQNAPIAMLSVAPPPEIEQQLFGPH